MLLVDLRCVRICKTSDSIILLLSLPRTKSCIIGVKKSKLTLLALSEQLFQETIIKFKYKLLYISCIPELHKIQ